MRDEAELIRAAAAGDPDAFEKLVDLKRGRVFRTAYQVVRNTEDARDVAQLVFVRLWRVIRRYRAGRNFDTWLYRITVNLAIDSKRRRAAQGLEVPLEAAAPAGSSAAELPAPGVRADEGTGVEELRRVYEAVADELTERQRLVFTMSVVDELPSSTIARALGVSDSTVRNTLFQARGILRRTLRRKFPEYFPASGRGGEDEGGRS